ncbi:hypothetical protein [Streptomyces sp. uw30]|uniref:hypothetical protein n=1 Tax=Streptomyces sp. uw30 TaxID=1828179 RepID=UPI0021C94817|nr:hypothetical protein [Streptomyces sp. uw30]
MVRSAGIRESELLLLAVIPPVSGMVEETLARRLGRPEHPSPQQLTATAETPAALVINGLPATGPRARS